jgi:hypothetical protein
VGRRVKNREIKDFFNLARNQRNIMYLSRLRNAVFLRKSNAKTGEPNSVKKIGGKDEMKQHLKNMGFVPSLTA